MRIEREKQVTMFEKAPLAPADTGRLAELEAVVRKGLQTFVEVGLALTEIREARLYRASHATFEAYCKERFDFGASRGRQLIAAAKLATELQTATQVTVPTERHVRALAPMVASRGTQAAGQLYAKLDDPTVEEVKEAVEAQCPKQEEQPPVKPTPEASGPLSEEEKQALLDDLQIVGNILWHLPGIITRLHRAERLSNGGGRPDKIERQFEKRAPRDAKVDGWDCHCRVFHMVERLLATPASKPDETDESWQDLVRQAERFAKVLEEFEEEIPRPVVEAAEQLIDDILYTPWPRPSHASVICDFEGPAAAAAYRARVETEDVAR